MFQIKKSSGFLRKPQKVDKISHLICQLLSKHHINLEISSILAALQYLNFNTVYMSREKFDLFACCQNFYKCLQLTEIITTREKRDSRNNSR